MQMYGVSTHETHLRPHDNLLQGPCYPVYPEIADALGVKGSYLFKTGGSYRYLSLNEFINFSYDSYQGRDKDMLHVNPQSASTLEAALEVLQS